MSQSDYQILSSAIDYSCPWFDVYKEKIEYPNKTLNNYFTLRKDRPYVGVIAIDKQNRLLILKQWRPTLRAWLFEIPMGGVEVGETPLQAIKREFQEETGYKARNWQLLGKNYLAAGLTNQIGHFYLATDLTKVKNGEQNHPHEIIEVHKFSIKEIDQMIRAGKFQDGPTLTALYLYNVFTNSRI